MARFEQDSEQRREGEPEPDARGPEPGKPGDGGASPRKRRFPWMPEGLWEALSTAPLTWTLMTLHLGIFVAMTMTSSARPDADTLLRWGAMFGPLVASGEYWRLITAMFLHAGFIHLWLNGLALFIFGIVAEKYYGSRRFAVIYLISGFAGGVASYGLNQGAVGVGASGAIFGVVGALAGLLISRGRTMGRTGKRDLASIIVMIVINLAIGWLLPFIDNWAHLGGLAAGLVLGYALAPRDTYELVVVDGEERRRWIETKPVGKRWLAPPIMALALVAAALAIGGIGATDADRAAVMAIESERLLEDGDANAALERAERAVGLDGGSARALLARGKALAEIGAVEQARSDLGAALRMQGLDAASREEAMDLLVQLRGDGG